MARLTQEQRQELEQRTGLDELRQFIPNDDYTEALLQHAAEGTADIIKADETDPGERNPIRENMVQRSVAILSYLRDNGYEFSIVPDRNPGQLMAKLADSKAKIRILDTDENAQYVGRIHDNAVSYRLSTKNMNITPVITPDMAVGLVKYSLGENVNRVDKTGANDVVLDSRVGAPDVTKNGRMYGSPSTYMTADGEKFTTKYTNGRVHNEPDASGLVRTVSDSVYIYAKSEARSSAASVKFRDVSPDLPTYADTVSTKVSEAENYVETSRETAIANFTAALKLEAVDMLAQSKARGEFDGDPDFSADSTSVVDMQKKYFDERYDMYSNKDNAYSTVPALVNGLFEHDKRTQQEISDYFGSMQNRTINPINVASYMDMSKGSINNENNLLSALKYLRRHDVGYEVVGEGFAEDGFRNKLIDYDTSPVYDRNGNQIYPKNINPASEDFGKLSKFWQDIGTSVNDGLSGTGVNVSEINVDKNGIVHYVGSRHVGESGISKPNNKVDGYIGQIFEPNNQPTRDDGTPNPKFGLIETRFNSDNNYYIAPGYSAYVVPPTGDNANKTVEERTRLKGYSQTMSDKIKSTLRHDIIANNNYDNTAGLNTVYHHLYGDKLSLNFEEQMQQEGKDDSIMLAVTESSRLRVRYNNSYKDGTSILAATNAEYIDGRPNRGYNMYLDNVRRVMPIMDAEASKGYFDPYATGTGTNQGIVRYLVRDAQVADDGRIIKGKETHTALTAHPDFAYAEFNPPDRFIMSYMNAVNQSSTARGRTENTAGEKIEPIGVGTAHMALSGYTQDDAFVISKDFADTNLIRGSDDIMRTLQIGDKICDHSGNKGVISYIADRNRDPSYYEPITLHEGMSEKQYKDAIKENNIKATHKKIDDVFRDNPTLDVIGAPYTAPSRFNGGTAREMIDSQSRAKEAGMSTTLNINNQSIEGGIGYPTWIVTDMPVDEKTHVYDSDGGRKASAQLIAALAEAGAKDVIDEIYKYNAEPTIKARELLLVEGYDISQTGELHKGYEPHVTGVDEDGNLTYEHRNEFSVKDNFDAKRDDKGNLHRKNFEAAFDESMGEDGGFMKLPFPIKLASGEMTPEKLDENGKGTGEYMLPVLAGKYRSSRETVDNKLTMHEYTTNYRNMYMKAGKYLTAQQQYDAMAASESPSATKMTEYKTAMEMAQNAVQSSYNAMSDEIGERYFTGKHNIWKDDVMRKQLSHTVTGVITPDPTLDIDEIAIPATMAENFGLSKDDEDPRLMIWRDPILSAGGIRYPRVKIVENRIDNPDYDPRNPMSNITGICMNPSSAKSFEGDFDGDSIGGYVPKTKKAKDNAMATLSYETQLLNQECNERGHHDLYFTQELDVAAGVYADKQNNGHIGDAFEEAKALANKANANHDMRIDANSDNHRALDMLNKAMHDAHDASFGLDVSNYSSVENHFRAAIHMTESGAKGSPAKLVNGYAPYLGVEVELDDNNQITKFVDHGHSLATVKDREASLSATHAKAVLTGVAGKFEQHAVMMAKNSNKPDVFSYANAANSLTHPVTQSVMQLKHDGAEEIRHKIDMIMNVAPALWAGNKIERVEGYEDKPTWVIVKERNPATGLNEPVPMTPDEFKKTFVEFYTDKRGLAVPPPNSEHIDMITDIMTMKDAAGKEYIKGFDKRERDKVAAYEKPLDSLAYEGSLKKIDIFATTRANLFNGSVNSLIAPKAVRDNIAESVKSKEDPSYVPVLKPLSAKDTQQTGTLNTPSVDETDALLKNPKFEDVEWERRGHLRHLKSGLIINVRPTTVHRHEPTPDVPLTQEQKTAAAYSIADKMLNSANPKEIEFTPNEKKFRDLLSEQSVKLKAAGNSHEQGIFLRDNPDACADIMAYRAVYDESVKAHNEGTKPYKAMTPEEKLVVAQSIADKAIAKDKSHFTCAESEFRSILRAQSEAYATLGNNEERQMYLDKNPESFKEYRMYRDVYKSRAAAQDTITSTPESQSNIPLAPVPKTVDKMQKLDKTVSGGEFKPLDTSQSDADKTARNRKSGDAGE